METSEEKKAPPAGYGPPCAECVHYQANLGAKILRHRAACWAFTFDIIDGWVRPQKGRWAIEMRREDGACGPEAKLFETREL